MKQKPNYQIVGDKIADLIQQGIELSDELVHFIDSTYAARSADDFRKILSDPDGGEAETVYELLFFPDEQFQKQLEPVLLNQAFNGEDLGNLIRYLKQKKIQTQIIFPNSSQKLEIYFPDSTIDSFISRLNITSTIDPRIAATLVKCVPEKSDMYQIRVMLRNSRVLFADPACAFVCEGIEALYPRAGYFWEAFSLMLDLLDQIDSASDIYAALIKKKLDLLKMIQLAEKSEKALSANSVETLMLKGVHIPSVSIDETRRQITLIDHICISIFGKTELIGIHDPLSYEAIHPSGGFDTLLKLLS